METIQLNNGHHLPLLGTGTNTYGKEENDYQGRLNGDFSALETAIKLGYRLIDTAISYRNESGVGKTVAESGLPREEFYLTTKIPAREEYIKSKDTVRTTLDQSLDNLQSDYIDLYLIHHPIEDKEQLKHTWEVLEEYVEAGKIKSIGVSNFTIDDLEYLQEIAKIKPSVNQIKSNPTEWNDELIEYCLENQIIPEAWGPMKTTEEQQERLAQIGDKYGKSWGQVLLRYQIQRDVIVIPKSHNSKNQQANFDIFDFDLTKEDIMKISSL
jgi:diketogulonate reductase-like aldo/keto reductase